ncbi:MAG TPA: NAD-dependent epimerase/dehydratase family protein, partial [Polyangiaceae bacterium]
MTEAAPLRHSPATARSRDGGLATTTGGAVLVTGICGRLGKHLARVLHRERRVVGVDRRAFVDKPKDVEHAQVDIRRKKLKDVFRAGD